jgi:hypothetical protein
MVKDKAVFENSVNARLLVKLTQYTVIVFWRNVEQYFHGSRNYYYKSLNSASNER